MIERAARLTDRLIVAIGINSEKSPYLSVEDRLVVLRQCTSHLSNVEVDAFEGLLIHYAVERDVRALIRGMRAVTDFDFEFRIAMANKTLAPEVDTLFLLARDQYSFLASSVVREVARLDGDISPFVPPPVLDLMVKRGLAGRDAQTLASTSKMQGMASKEATP